MTRPKLSTSQQKYLKWIAEVIAKTGKSPTLEEIGDHFKSTAVNAYKIVQILVRKGYVKKTGNGPVRTLVVLDDEGNGIVPNQLPLIGRVAAGLPVLAVENRIGMVTLDEAFLRRGASFVLVVQGESMLDAGILPGDKVIIKQQPTAETGQIVLALLGEEATIKRFYPQTNGSVILKPENRSFSDIVVATGNCSIQGVVIGCYREIE